MTDATPYAPIIARCWSDETYKQRLLADPAGTLKAAGLAVPERAVVKVLEDTADAVHLVIPTRPTDLSDDQLAGTAGGIIVDV